ncbi:MAG: hypothetical protein ABDH28_03455 [Brevinematia bacterium]
MCLLAYLPKNKTMSLSEVMSAYYGNRDGMGIAHEVNGKWFVEKGITNPEEFQKKIETLRKHRKIVHFRAASSGGIDPDLTHPFETRKFIIAQNGTLPNWENLQKTIFMLNPMQIKWVEYNQLFNYNPEKISDTKLIAFLLYLAEEDTINIDKVLEIISKAGRVALIVKEVNKILWFGDRKEDNERVFSNDSYKFYANRRLCNSDWK